jgi:hypothetical protein
MAKVKHEELFRVLLREKHLGEGNRSVLVDAVVLDELAEIPWRKSVEHIASSLGFRYGPCFAEGEIEDALARLGTSSPHVEFKHGGCTYLPTPIEILGDVRWRVNPLSLPPAVRQFKEACARFCPNADWVTDLWGFVRGLRSYA